METVVAGLRMEYLGGKGDGLVAAQDFPRGTQMILEKPHMWFNTTQSLASIAAMLELGAGSMSTKSTPELESILPPVFGQQPSKDRPMTVKFSRLHKNGGRFSDQTPEQFASANILPAKSISGGTAMMVNYLTIIRLINHACFPNAEYSWNDKLKMGTVYAVCDIKAGDEITINYGYEMYQCRSDHIRGKFGFICLCNTCMMQTSLRRDAASGMHLKLRDEEVALLNESFLITSTSSCRKYHPETCLRKLYWRYQHFKNQGYQDSRVNNILLEAFQILAGHEDTARALYFAKRYLEAQVECYGQDADDIEKWQGMLKIENLTTYVEESFSDKWYNPVERTPTDHTLNMEAWMWARKAPGGLLW